MKIFQHDDPSLHFMNHLTFVIQIGSRGHWVNNASGSPQVNNQNDFSGVLVYEYENPSV